jgi:hypothetical protein
MLLRHLQLLAQKLLHQPLRRLVEVWCIPLTEVAEVADLVADQGQSPWT